MLSDIMLLIHSFQRGFSCCMLICSLSQMLKTLISWPWSIFKQLSEGCQLVQVKMPYYVIVPLFTMHYMYTGTMPEQPASLLQREWELLTNNSHNKCSGCAPSFSSAEAEGKNYFDKVANIPISELKDSSGEWRGRQCYLFIVRFAWIPSFVHNSHGLSCRTTGDGQLCV